MAKPEKLPPNQFDHFYKGGYKIGSLRGGPGGPMRPEEWIGSTTTRYGETYTGLSKLSSGELLVDVIGRESEAWLGREHLNTFGSSTEILVKLLDPDQALPVHFHPTRKFAKEHLGVSHGKTEAWIIVDAPAGAKVGLGFKKEMSKTEVLPLVAGKQSQAIIDSLEFFEVKPGDAFFVPSGIPHAIGAGIFVMEMQEPTDYSGLLEWEGFAVDGEKDVHYDLGFDILLDDLRYSPLNKNEIEKWITHDRLNAATDVNIFSESANPYFRANYLSGKVSSVEAGFAIFLALSGQGRVNFENAGEMETSRGEAVVIPYSAGGWTLTGVGGILTRPPLPHYARLAQ